MTKFSELKYNVLTEEPIFIVHQFKHVSLVRRPVMSDKGIKYKFGFFFNAELEDLRSKTERSFEQIKEQNKIAIEFDMREAGEVQNAPFTLAMQQFKKDTN